MINTKENKEGEMYHNVDKLIKAGVLFIGHKARKNPEKIDKPNFCLGIANKDYPAMTPFLWNAVFQQLGFERRNIRLFGDPANIELIFQAFKNDRRYIGGDVGVGFKDKAWLLVDELDPLAKMMQAINVVVKLADGRLKGYNTDGLGYTVSLKDKLHEQGKELPGQKVVILGAGGTGNAIAFALADAGAKVVILNRTVSKAEDLAGRINGYFGKELALAGGRDQIRQEASGAAAIISVIDDPSAALDKCCALGEINYPLTDTELAENLADAREVLAALPKDVIISDVMLREGDTATITEAKKAGLATLDGRPMVLNQAIEAFWLVNQDGLQAKGFDKRNVAEIMVKASEQK
jgi:shikimate 5-dehydrogenase